MSTSKRKGVCVYIVRSETRSGVVSFYTGISSDPWRRFKEHESGRGARFLKGRVNLEMRVVNEFETRAEAMARELEVKKMRKARKAKLFEDGFY